MVSNIGLCMVIGIVYTRWFLIALACLLKFNIIICSFEWLIDLWYIDDNFSFLVVWLFVIVLSCDLGLSISVAFGLVLKLLWIVVDYLLICLAVVVELFVAHISNFDVVRHLGTALHWNRLLALDDVALDVGWWLRTAFGLLLFHSNDIFWTSLDWIGLRGRNWLLSLFQKVLCCVLMCYVFCLRGLLLALKIDVLSHVFDGTLLNFILTTEIRFSFANLNILFNWFYLLESNLLYFGFVLLLFWSDIFLYNFYLFNSFIIIG